MLMLVHCSLCIL